MTERTQGINVVNNKYETRGFEVHCWHTINELNQDEIIKTVNLEKLETYSRGEHVGVLEI